MKLTQFSKSAGCAAKLGPRELAEALALVRTEQPPEVLIGYERSDDAGVYLIAPDLALVQTVDYFTPIVDDPYTYGQIAAANALSDIYAMGGTPKDRSFDCRVSRQRGFFGSRCNHAGRTGQVKPGRRGASGRPFA